MNMLALAQLGTIVENLAGGLPMLWIYTVALLGSGLSVVAFSGNEVTVGASGAIYGLFGGLLAIGLRLGPHGRTLVASTLPILVVNMVLTFMVPNISIAAISVVWSAVSWLRWDCASIGVLFSASPPA